MCTGRCCLLFGAPMIAYTNAVTSFSCHDRIGRLSTTAEGVGTQTRGRGALQSFSAGRQEAQHGSVGAGFFSGDEHKSTRFSLLWPARVGDVVSTLRRCEGLTKRAPVFASAGVTRRSETCDVFSLSFLWFIVPAVFSAGVCAYGEVNKRCSLLACANNKKMCVLLNVCGAVCYDSTAILLRLLCWQYFWGETRGSLCADCNLSFRRSRQRRRFLGNAFDGLPAIGHGIFSLGARRRRRSCNPHPHPPPFFFLCST